MMRSGAALGVLLVALVSVFSAVADGLTKELSASLPPAQLYFFCGLLVMAASLGMNRMGLGPSGQLRTTMPRLMLLRTGFVLASVLCYYYAFASLPLSEVFVFIGLMPLLAALLSGPLLRESLTPMAWGAVVIGGAGILFVFPEGLEGFGFGHLMALGGVSLGTVSLMLMRHMARREANVLAQVFWPHAGLALAMGMVLPFVWRPMTGMDMLLVAAYGVAILVARWLMVPCLQRLPTHVATMLLNLQFVWMVGLDWMAFEGWPVSTVLVGAGFIILSAVILLWDQARKGAASVPTVLPVARSPAPAKMVLAE